MSETAVAAEAEQADQPWVAPASYAQERVWFASQFATDVPVYHVQDRFRLPYPLPAEAILAALDTIVERHETLRTSFRVEDGVLMQVVHPAPALPVAVLDLPAQPPHQQRERLEQLADELVFAPFALDRGPLWRGTLVRLAEDGWLLQYVAHHAVMDAASFLNFHAELTELCAAAVQGREATLPELAIQYGDFAVWQRGRLQGAELAELERFWRDALDDLPLVHRVPTDRRRPMDRGFAGAELLFTLPDTVVAGLPLVSRRTGATPFMVLLAGYVAVLHRLSGQRDVVVGVPVGGRDLPELQPLIGMFVNMVALRFRLTGQESFAELVELVLQRSVAAWDHQEMPFQKLVEIFGAHRDPGVAPIYQLGFNYLPSGVSSQSSTAEDELMLELAARDGRLEYNTGLFDEATARSIVDSYLAVLGAALADPELPIAGLPVRALTGENAEPAEPVDGKPGGYVAPRTDAEELVAQVWQEVLNVARVGATDDFFDLGGHSLLALRVIARLCDAADVELTIQAFFADTTVAGVAAELERLLEAEIDALSEDEARRLVDGGDA